jgi:hypothetical protein
MNILSNARALERKKKLIIKKKKKKSFHGDTCMGL